MLKKIIEWVRFRIEIYCYHFTVAPIIEAQRSGPLSQIGQALLRLQYSQATSSANFGDVGMSVYSEFEEDGLLLYIFSIIGFGSRRCIEIGCGTGNQNNTANLIINHSWKGFLIDADPANCRNASRFFARNQSTKLLQPEILCSMVTPENVNETILASGFSGSTVDLLSIDIDSIDLWVLEALNVTQPRVIIVEINARWAADESMTTPRDGTGAPVFDPELGMIFGGASLAAFCKLLGPRGYRLIGSNQMATNVIFLRNDERSDFFPEVSAESVLSKERAVSIRNRCIEKIKKYDWETF